MQSFQLIGTNIYDASGRELSLADIMPYLHLHADLVRALVTVTPYLNQGIPAIQLLDVENTMKAAADLMLEKIKKNSQASPGLFTR